MSSLSSQRTVEISRSRDRQADAALILGILAVPGGTLAWDVPYVGGWPFVVGAIVGLAIGVQAWHARRARRALAGAILCTAMALFTAAVLIAWAL
jgi:hypothetical protein